MASLAAGRKRPFSSLDDSPALVGASPALSAAIQSHNSQSRSLSVFSTPEAAGHSTPSIQLFSRTFNPDASVVLVGARGTGKSTLGVIASTVCHRRLVDSDHAFREETGCSPSVFRKTHGTEQYQKRSLETLKRLLMENEKNAIIVCNGSLSKESQAFLSRYGTSHPVIHILRDVQSIQEHLNSTERDKISDLVEASDRTLRTCSNFEFFNLSEPSQSFRPSTQAQHSPDDSPGQRSPSPYLALKYAEQHFLKFLSSATGMTKVPALEDACPLSRVRLEDRLYTYIVSISISHLLARSFDIEKLENGADAFELKIDASSTQPRRILEASSSSDVGSLKLTDITHHFASIRRNTMVPIVFHVELDQGLSGTSAKSSQISEYLDLVHHGLRLAPEYVTLNMALEDDRIRDVIKRKGSSRTIAHCFSSNPDHLSWNHSFWLAAYKRARDLGFDIVRLCWPARSITDNFGVHHFRNKIKQLGHPILPVIAYNTGPLGKTSCCFNPVMTPVTHDDIPANENISVTASQATDALYKSFVFEPMRFYILGASTGYSLSPAMHSAAYKVCGMPHTYGTRQTDTLNELRKLVQDPHFGGCSISLPFKIEIISLTHSLSKHAKAIGAINTLLAVRSLRPDGSIPNDLDLFRERNRSGPIKALYGENTDWIGIRACVRRGLSPVNAVRPNSTALIIGAGGMARAAVYAMLQLGVRNIFIHNRTKSHAEKLISHFKRLPIDSSYGQDNPSSPQTYTEAGFHFAAINDREQEWPANYRHPNIIISAIPTHSIGKNPAPNFVLPTQWLRSAHGGVVMELAYRNIRTPLMEQIRALTHKGWVTMDGLDLLPEQGFAQFELFTGRRAPRRLMRAEVLRNYRDEEGKTDPEYIQWRLDALDEYDQ